jgi:hypothetical protein
MESALVPSATNGHISAVKVDYKHTPVIQSDAAITHGNSGGPAFNANGEAIAIATYGPEVAGFNFFVPINTAMEFVRQAGAPPESGPFDKSWAAALEAYQAGNWDTAKGLLADSLNFMPDLPDALRLQTVAAQNARSEGPVARLAENFGGAGGMLLPAGGGALVLILGASTFFIMRARRSAPVPLAATVLSMPNVKIEPLPGAPLIPPARHAAVHFGSMHVTSGVLTGNQFPIPKAGLLIGRDSSKCNVVVADDTVSKEHAWIVPLENEVVVIDRGSSNGTYINSIETAAINKVTLRNGDRVFIGKKGAAVLTYFSA